MLKKKIKYTDFDGNEHEEVFHFHITKPELVELEAGYKMGFKQYLDNIIEAEDRASLVAEFKRIITMAYGEKSLDGKHFKKTPELTELFTQHAAYPVLYMELATDSDAAADFIIGVMPQDLADEHGAQMRAAVQEELPPPPLASA